MDINEALSIIPRSLISLITLFIATKILGKKQVSELSLFDYVMGISIGNFSAEMILVLDGQIINGVVAILTFGIVGFLISYLSTKSIVIRRLFFQTPTVIMQEGKINYHALKKLNIDINDFLEQTRSLGYFDLNEISYAIMEANGKLSIIEKDEYKKPTKKDLKLKIEKESYPANIIIHGNMMYENINETDKSTSYFIKELKKQGYKTYENILLALYINNSLTIYRKDEFIHKEDTLE